MKSINYRSMLSHVTVFVLTIAILTGQTMFVFAVPAGSFAAGEVTVTGTAKTGEKPFVLINGDPAFSGRTFFADGTITTPEASSASIDFGKIGRINLGPDSTLTLRVSETNITGMLSTGSIRVSNSDGVSVKIETPDDMITNEGISASRFTINVAGNKSSVAAESGVVRYNNGLSSMKDDDDDDDDDDDGNIWVPIIIIGGAIGAVLFFTVLNDDDDDVSPVR